MTTNNTHPYYWRPANTYDQLSNETTIAYPSATTAESTLSFNSGQSVSDLRVTVDGFGKSILSQVLQGPGATNYDTTETDFNSLGQPNRSTMPFSAAAGVYEFVRSGSQCHLRCAWPTINGHSFRSIRRPELRLPIPIRTTTSSKMSAAPNTSRSSLNTMALED